MFLCQRLPGKRESNNFFQSREVPWARYFVRRKEPKILAKQKRTFCGAHSKTSLFSSEIKTSAVTQMQSYVLHDMKLIFSSFDQGVVVSISVHPDNDKGGQSSTNLICAMIFGVDYKSLYIYSIVVPKWNKILVYFERDAVQQIFDGPRILSERLLSEISGQPKRGLKKTYHIFFSVFDAFEQTQTYSL